MENTTKYIKYKRIKMTSVLLLIGVYRSWVMAAATIKTQAKRRCRPCSEWTADFSSNTVL